MSAALAATGWGLALAALAGVLGARRSHERRMELVARAVHELRGPLTAIGLGVAAMERSRIAPRHAALEAIAGSVDRAALALDDLEVARRGRRARDRRVPVEVSDVLSRSAEQWRAVAAARGVELIVAPTPPAVVQGDERRLVQACGNLVANAIEHGAGPVVLSGRLGAGGVALEVSDRGPGLPAPVADLEHRARGGRGARGRGLAIAGQIARRHGGRLATAPSERGTRLALELPAGTTAA